jgi:integrase
MPAEVIDGNSLRRAANVAAARGDLMLRDKLTPGLAIRIQKGSAAWFLITRDTRISLGPLGSFGRDKIDLLRETVGKARAMLDRGEDPKPFLRAFATSHNAEKATADADVATGRAMRWEALRDAYLAWAKENRREDTYRTYRSALGAVVGSPLESDFEPLVGRPATSISAHDLRLVRNRILKRGQDASRRQVGNVRQATLTLAALKAAFGWAVENYELTGLTANPSVEVKPVQAPKARAKDDVDDEDLANRNRRVLTLEEIGTLMNALDTWHNNGARIALVLQLMTGQRRKTIVEARKRNFMKTEDYGLLWYIGPDKSGKYRVLPLPALAESAVEAAKMAARGDSPWLFPQQRLRRAGDAGDGHMAERMINEILENFRKPGRPVASAPFLATHDLRRAFVTHVGRRLRDLGLPEGATELVTRGDEGRVGLDARTYDLDVRMPEKWSMLKEWERLVKEGSIQAAEAAKSA